MHPAVATTADNTWTSTDYRVLRAPWRLFLCLTASAVLLLTALTGGVGGHVYQQHHSPLWVPVVEPLPLLPTFYDVTPTEVRVTRNWLKFSLVMPRYQFVTDPTIWRQMHFDDWDRLDAASRHQGLTNMLAMHGHLLADPGLWRRMGPHEWDDVPQPVRAMAIVGMIEQWVAVYEVGAVHALDPRLVLRTAKAIAMSESWFDHRALHINPDGSTDIGLGGASVFAREALGRLRERGLADFTLRDDEYYNPWLASRWLAFWLRLSLDEAGGDLALAIRAYNVGIGRATRGQGQEYLAGVERRRRRYFEGPSDSPTWSALSQYRRDQLWIPRVIVRAPLEPRAPVAPCVEPTCALPAAPAREPGA